MSAIGIIFSNIHDENMPEITELRTMAAVPFGGRYRLIDFVLSNMVNSEITKIGIITKNNYSSLMDHVGSGRDWDLSRKNGGIKIFPPYGKRESSGLYRGRLEALRNTYSFLEFSRDEDVILSDCDIICNIDLREVLEFHRKTDADITSVCTRQPVRGFLSSDTLIYDYDRDRDVTKVMLGDKNAPGSSFGINIWAIRRELLRDVVEESFRSGEHSFTKNVLMNRRRGLSHKAFEYGGYCARIDSLASYMHHNKEMLIKKNRDALLNVPGRPVFTKVRDSTPTKYGMSAAAANSLVADGCMIEGSVRDSVIFRDVRIGKGALVENSVVMQGTVIGRNAKLNNVIADKNVVIKDNLVLSSHESMPFYIEKEKVVG